MMRWLMWRRHRFIPWPAPGWESHCLDCGKHRFNIWHWGRPPYSIAEENE